MGAGVIDQVALKFKGHDNNTVNLSQQDLLTICCKSCHNHALHYRYRAILNFTEVSITFGTICADMHCIAIRSDRNRVKDETSENERRNGP